MAFIFAFSDTLTFSFFTVTRNKRKSNSRQPSDKATVLGRRLFFYDYRALTTHSSERQIGMTDAESCDDRRPETGRLRRDVSRYYVRRAYAL